MAMSVLLEDIERCCWVIRRNCELSPEEGGRRRQMMKEPEGGREKRNSVGHCIATRGNLSRLENPESRSDPGGIWELCTFIQTSVECCQEPVGRLGREGKGGRGRFQWELYRPVTN